MTTVYFSTILLRHDMGKLLLQRSRSPPFSLQTRGLLPTVPGGERHGTP